MNFVLGGTSDIEMHNKIKLVEIQFKNPYKMLPTMHIGNIDIL